MFKKICLVLRPTLARGHKPTVDDGVYGGLAGGAEHSAGTAAAAAYCKDGAAQEEAIPPPPPPKIYRSVNCDAQRVCPFFFFLCSLSLSLPIPPTVASSSKSLLSD